MARILIAAAPFSLPWDSEHGERRIACVMIIAVTTTHWSDGFFMKASIPKGKAVDVAGVASHIERAES